MQVYGFGKSEELIGDLMKKTGTSPAIATKFAPLPFRFGADNVVNTLKVSNQACAHALYHGSVLKGSKLVSQTLCTDAMLEVAVLLLVFCCRHHCGDCRGSQ